MLFNDRIRLQAATRMITRLSIVYVDTWLGSPEHFDNPSGNEWDTSNLGFNDYGSDFFIEVDGDHSVCAVFQDVTASIPLLAPNAILCGDDFFCCVAARCVLGCDALQPSDHWLPALAVALACALPGRPPLESPPCS